MSNFCVNCIHYKWKFFSAAKCVIVLERDTVTGKPTKVKSMNAREAREHHCKGVWFRERLD